MIDECKRVAFADMGDFLDAPADGKVGIILPLAEPETLAVLREIVIEQHIERPDGLPPLVRHVDIKLASKIQALGLLRRFAGAISANATGSA